jgi:dTDP-4-dehydrorhamnose reductase
MYLIIGGDAEIGQALAAVLRTAQARVVCTTRRAVPAPGWINLDLAAIPADWAPPDGTQAACITAAVARLAACEADPAGAARVNVDGTIALAERLAARGIYTLFLSTNQVFDGTVPNVAADARVCPVSIYGKQKAQTETVLRAMMTQGAPIGILRLSKVISPAIPLFTRWRDSLAAGTPVHAFADMPFAPVPAALVTTAIMALLNEKPAKVVQLSGPRDITYLEAARYIARRQGADSSLVLAGSATTLGLAVGSIPTHTTLDSRYLRDRHQIIVPDALEVVKLATGTLEEMESTCVSLRHDV